MPKGITERKRGRERLQTIIEMCKSVEERSLDPFQIDADEILDIIRKYFPEWKLPEDLCLDAETIHRLASIINLQSEWVKHRSTSLYKDPFLLEDKLTKIGKRDIVKIFLRTWHPIVELEQMTLQSLAKAIEYWENLLPLNERWSDFPPEQKGAGHATKEELIRQGILGDKIFSRELEKFWQRLKKEVEEKGKEGKIRYWDFIGAETYEETVQKAFMASFLITYDYATLEIHPLEEEIFIKPCKGTTKNREKQLISIPLAITTEDWTKWKRGELYE
jgi:hypothetical protein